MKVIIAGTRTGTTTVAELDAIIERSGLKVDEVVSGGCRGVDRTGELWAEQQGLPVKLFMANWNGHGRAAGPIRNREMAAYADALIAIWDGKSRGTDNMIAEAKKAGLVVYGVLLTAPDVTS